MTKLNNILQKSLDDLKKVSFWTESACETMVSFILMAVVIFITVTNNEHLYSVNTTHLALFVTGFVFMAIEAYGPIACSLNPMGSFSMFLAGKISLARCLVFTAGELVGGTAGSFFGYLLTPPNASIPYFDPAVHNMTNWQAVAMEGFFSFNLIFVVLSVHGTELKRTLPTLPSLSIAFALAIGLFSAGTHTGGFMNPLIPLGPAIINQKFVNHWVYWVGPYIGGPTAVLVYMLMVKGKLYKPKDPILPEAKALHNIDNDIKQPV